MKSFTKRNYMVILALIIFLLLSYTVSAGTNAIITIPLNNNATAAIELTPKNWNFFELLLGQTNETSLTHFLIHNNGTVGVTVYVKGSNSQGWTINKTAPGTNKFQLEYKIQFGGDWSSIGSTDGVFLTNFEHAENHYFGMKILMPTGSSTAVTPQMMNVTFTATAN